jgi:hypothetical protein
MPSDVSPDSTVSYTVKELLDEQTGLLRRIDHKVDQKADKADLVAIERRLDGHSTRIQSLEDHRDEVEIIRRFRRRAWAIFGSASGVAAIIVGALIQRGHL